MGGLTPSEVTYLGIDASGDTFSEKNYQQTEAALFSRFRIPNTGTSEAGLSSTSDSPEDDAFWQGSIALDDDELDQLASAVVAQVKLRGPFLSMGEFLNRQLGPTSPLTLTGALQAAIDNTSINEDSTNGVNGYEIDESQLSEYELSTPEAVAGDSAQGAPGYLTQADIINTLSNSVTVRSDTFRIRAYGESRNRAGKTLATAYCEAIVQRTPEYLDTTDDPWDYPEAEDGTSSAIARATDDIAEIEPLESESNQKFGRRFVVKSFRWLNPSEV